jgi:hypothetical protein
MLVQGIKSRPQYSGLLPDTYAINHVFIADKEGARAYVEKYGHSNVRTMHAHVEINPADDFFDLKNWSLFACDESDPHPFAQRRMAPRNQRNGYSTIGEKLTVIAAPNCDRPSKHVPAGLKWISLSILFSVLW